MSDNNIVQMPIASAMAEKYLTYAMYSIQDRALPNGFDGLKPVALRIIHSMNEMGLKANAKQKKSARVVGDVIGKFHPHGDTSVYEAAVRMSQDWTLRYPIIDFQGNNGSRDNDSAAAMRYTEIRLSHYGEQLLKDVNKNTVDFKANYDDTEVEPIAAPSLIPNLLANGGEGIAAGMATSIPPHNLTELYEACEYLIDNSDRDDITTEELMQFVKGPDFPDGGTIVDTKDLLKAYNTGRGKVVLRAKYEIETVNKNNVIVITELPYQTNKEALKKKIYALGVTEGKIEGIKDVLDETGQNGVRLAIYLKKDANAQVVINKLLKMTDMQKSISFNVMALINRQPMQLGLKDCLEYFLAHAMDVVTRRSQFDYDKAQQRALLVSAMLTVMADIENTIDIIRNSETPVETLMSTFELTKEQAEYVYEMKVKTLSRQSEEKLSAELITLTERMNHLASVLSDQSVLLAELKSELIALKERFGDARRTQISTSANVNINEEDLIKDETLVVTVTSEGLIKSVEEKEYNTQKRGGKGSKSATTKDDEVVVDLFTVNSKDDLLFISNQGRCHAIKAYKLPKVSRTAKGKSINNFINLNEDEYPVSTIVTKLNDPENSIVFVTAKGVIKRLPVTHLSTRMSVTKVIGLKDGDELVAALIAKENDDVLICTALGQGLRTKINEKIRPMGRSAAGVRGIKVADNDIVIGMTKITDDIDVLTVTQLGLGKKTKGSDYPAKGRGGKGIKTHKVTDRTGPIVACLAVKEEHDVFVGTMSGQIIRLNVDNLAKSGRDTTGSKLINLAEGDQAFTASFAPNSEILEDENE
jgi:DNA gyrase subunit A